MDEQVIPVAILPPTNQYESYLSSASIYRLALMTNLNATNKRSISYDNLDRSSCRYCWYCCFYNGSQTGICRVHASTSAAGEMLSSRKPRKSPASSGLLSPRKWCPNFGHKTNSRGSAVSCSDGKTCLRKRDSL